MTEETHPPVQPSDPCASQEGESDARQPGQLRRLRGFLGRLGTRAVFACRWLWRPDQVGKPVMLRPRHVRLLVFLVLGNLAALALLSTALCQSARLLAAVEQPPDLPPLVTTTLTPLPTPGPSPTPLGSGGAVAFTMRRNGNTDIYAFNQADQQLIRLTYDPAEDRDPTWSPDGSQIAFASNRSDNWDIYLLDLASGALIRLTRDPGYDGNPSWSPDGRFIAFESYRNNNLDIYLMTPNGREVRRLTIHPSPEYDPSWSPDSRAIAFTTLRRGSEEIYLRLFDGSGRTINVTNSPDIDENSASWSPDGTRLAYVSGPPSNPSIQVAIFDWETLVIDQGNTEMFGSGAFPTWAPDGQSFLYVYKRGNQSHLIAAGVTGWGMFQEVSSIEGMVTGLAWTGQAISPRVMARARADDPGSSPPLYVTLVQPTPPVGPPYSLVPVSHVNVPTGTRALLNDRVDESFDALRQRVIEEAGWDYLGTLSSVWAPLTYTPPVGHSRMSWHICGRAIGLDQAPYSEAERRIALAREDVGSATYWRVFLRTARQDGSQGEPLRQPTWDLNARFAGGRAEVEGGALEERIPPGYYVDLTALAADYGWERVPALWRWRYFQPDIRWWELQKTDGLTWWECMLEVFEPQEIEEAFGPIPGYEEP